MDSHGRVFYIDHASRTTSWQRPPHTSTSTLTSTPCVNDLPDRHRQQLDRRYQSIRRTIAQARHGSPTVPVSANVENHNHQSVNNQQQQQSNVPLPALSLLIRPDFYSLLHTNQDALTLYNRNAALKHMVSRIRRDASSTNHNSPQALAVNPQYSPNMHFCPSFMRYQHNKDLVALVNAFADKARDLPPGWESKRDRNGKEFFIDHTNRLTTFMDPRIPLDSPIRTRSRQDNESAPVVPPRPPSSPRPTAQHIDIPIAYNDKVCAYINI